MSMTPTTPANTLRRRRPPGTALATAVLVVLAMVAAPAAHATPTWLAPHDVFSFGDAISLHHGTNRPAVSMDSQGDVVTAWPAPDPGGQTGHVVAATRSPGGQWSQPQELSPPNQADYYSIRVAVGANGDAVASWVYRAPGANNAVVQVAIRPAGALPSDPRGGWSEPQTLTTPNGNAGGPRVAVDANGDAVVAWYTYPDGVAVATHPAGASPSDPQGGWSQPQIISGPMCGRPDVALDPRGNAMAVWTCGRSTVDALGQTKYIYTVQAARRPAGRDWQPAQDLTAPDESGGGEQQVEFDGEGNAVAKWTRDVSNTQQIVRAASRPAAGGLVRDGWTDPQDISSSVKVAYEPQLAVDPQGGAVIVWLSIEGVIQAAARPAGGGWGAAENITGVGESVSEPQVALDARGNAIAIWDRTDGTSAIVESATHRAGAAGTAINSSWSAPQRISTPTTSTGSLNGETKGALYPQLAADAQGDAAAVWTFGTDTDTTFQVTGFDAAGPQLRNLSVPATGSAGSPLSFSVAPVDVWSSVKSTSWSFDGDGSSASGESVSHTYAAAGTYVVAVTSTDSLGNATTERRTVVITDTPSGTGGGTGGSGSTVPPAALPPAALPPVAAPPAALPPALASGDLAAALAAERLRATGLRSCLGRVARRAAAQRRQARLLSAGPRRIAMRQITHRAHRGRSRCLLRFGRTPGRVSGLAARVTGPGTIALGFQAAGTDHALPPASRRYVVKQSLRPIRTQADFRAARVLCSGSCRFPNAILGERESLTVTDLKPHRTYYYAVLARDNVSGRPGPRSETISIKTR